MPTGRSMISAGLLAPRLGGPRYSALVWRRREQAEAGRVIAVRPFLAAAVSFTRSRSPPANGTNESKSGERYIS